MSNTKNDDLLSNPNLDKVEEYFKLKGVIKTLRGDLKDIKDSLEAQIELEKLSKKTKELRDKVKGDETVFELSEKLATTRERLELIKELIRIDLIETAQEEVKRDGKKLKLVHVLKEVKDDGKDDKKKSK
ncbi:MAG: hypothetical protein ACMG57_00565 [Candidatus Dojkabacteria bacterium]